MVDDVLRRERGERVEERRLEAARSARLRRGEPGRDADGEHGGRRRREGLVPDGEEGRDNRAGKAAGARDLRHPRMAVLDRDRPALPGNPVAAAGDDPDHARRHSTSLLAAHASEQGFDDALGGLLKTPFDAALAAAPPQRLRVWLATLVKLDEQFEWDAPADACYRHARHPKAREVALSRATELMQAAADRGWNRGHRTADPEGPRWPGLLADAADGGLADADCLALLAAARELLDAPDEHLYSGLQERLSGNKPSTTGS